RSTRQSDKRKARQVLLDWLREHDRLEEIGVVGKRFRDAIDEWLELKSSTNREISLKNERYILEGLFVAEWGDLDCDEIDLADVEKVLFGRKELQASTRNLYLKYLRAFFSWAQRRRYVRENPTDGVHAPRFRPKSKRPLSIDEARRLLAAARKSRTKELWLALLISLHTGLRRSNVLGMRVRHVSISEERFSFDRTDMKSKREFTLPIHPEPLDVLRPEIGREDSSPNALVLGRELHDLRYSLRSACRRAGVPEIAWHDLRHTWSTWLSTRVPWAVQQRLLDHQPKDITWDYTHVPWEELVRGVQTIPNLLADGHFTKISKTLGKDLAN